MTKNDFFFSFFHFQQKQTEKTGCMSCCLVLSPQKILMCHEDLQSSFYRTLGSASIVDITSILQDPVVKTYCVLVSTRLYC